MEHENEELASKLADLTTQAKMMLLNNESLEEAIQDQQIEYEERIAELEGLLADKYESDDQILLKQQAKADLSGQNPSEGHDEDQITRIVDATLESSESDPVTAVNKMVVSDATSVIIESPQTDDEGMRKTIASTHILTTENQFDRVPSPKQDSENQDETKATMQQDTPVDYDIISKGRYALDHVSSELVDLSEPTQIATDFLASTNPPTTLLNLQASPVKTEIEQGIAPSETDGTIQYELGAASPQGILMTTSNVTKNVSCAPIPPQTISPDVEDQVKKLIVENGELAQRLGNAVADKECKRECSVSCAMPSPVYALIIVHGFH